MKKLFSDFFCIVGKRIALPYSHLQCSRGKLSRAKQYPKAISPFAVTHLHSGHAAVAGLSLVCVSPPGSWCLPGSQMPDLGRPVSVSLLGGQQGHPGAQGPGGRDYSTGVSVPQAPCLLGSFPFS